MNRTVIIACVIQLLATGALARQQSPPADLARLPDEIKNLPWQSIDLSTVAPLEYDRALLIMNHVLDEIAPVRASEADLMSSYIQSQNLGPAFAKAPPPPLGKHLSLSDATKIAVALLRGPMANSSYASQLSGTSPEGLAAYQQMYDGTCQRRWGEIVESLQQVRCMSAFLNKQGKIKDYEAWAKIDSENRRLKYQLEMDKRQNAEERSQQQHAEQARADAQQAMLQQENQQLQQALASAQMQMQKQATAAQQQQQPIPENQMTPEQLQQQANAMSADAGGGYYPAYGAYYPPTYYGAGAAWCHDAAYAGAARAQTEGRISGWHGAPAAGVRR